MNKNKSAASGLVSSLGSSIKWEVKHISVLSYDPLDREQSLIYQSLFNDGKGPISYNKLNDFNLGLAFCVHGLWGYKIAISSFQVQQGEFSCTLKYTLYDHFGLSSSDLDGIYQLSDGVQAWYILQHYIGFRGAHKPFVTIMEFEITIEGEL